MLTQFSQGIGGKLLEQWFAQILTPSFAFWGGGLLFLINEIGWEAASSWFIGMSEAVQVGILLGLLLLVIVTSQLMQQLNQPILRLLEGYWPKAFANTHKVLVARKLKKAGELDAAFQLASQKKTDAIHSGKDLPREIIDKYIEADWALHRMPLEPEYMMPTDLGNILRSAERLPTNKYGLDAIICWPRLWLLLPEGTQTEISRARAALDANAQLWIWGALFMLWTPIGWWAIYASLLTLYIAYQLMLQSAARYADLVEAAYDLHRFKLYESLHLPRPRDPQDELEKGQGLTRFLWRGPIQSDHYFFSGE